ncbi:hypothetical protein GUJ93_ZPchr0014g46712 [Zizania palustris]|uniref:3-oxo-5-alpha-steroid 4-dehydrogenase C-terminal domain-containing protein n=1 Tax=Zizania palustris TaxID=103762 RepID=A0A8J5VVA8_ZIZPA|nr:hypothetical protein GUJ93_ZPchr0014g46712 [Zizania palustris]
MRTWWYPERRSSLVKKRAPWSSSSSSSTTGMGNASLMVIYFGMLVAGGGADIPVWFLFIFVITNLSFAAVQTHKWYLQKFEDYPRSRYAIIPFIR